jgi:hypothetical protein
VFFRSGSEAVGSDGVRVQVGEGFVRYVRGGRKLTVPIEYVYGEDGILIYESTIRAWDTPQGGELIGSIERHQILKEIGEALAVLGVKHRIYS